MSAERKPVSSRPAPAAPTRWQVGALRTSVQILLAVCVLVAALWVIHRIQGVLLVLALAVLFAYLVAPVVAFFSRPVTVLGAPRAMPATLAIVAAYLAIFGTLAGAVALILPVLNAQFADFRAELPGYVLRLEAGWQGWLKGQTRMLPRDMRAGIEGIVGQASAGLSHYVQDDFLPRVGGWLMNLPWLILVPIFAFFLLRDADVLRRAALGLFPGRQLRWRGDVFFEDVNRTLAAYIRAQLLACLVVAILCTGGFLWIGLQYGVVLGIAAGLLELLPLVGPLTIAILAVAVGDRRVRPRRSHRAGLLHLSAAGRTRDPAASDGRHPGDPVRRRNRRRRRGFSRRSRARHSDGGLPALAGASRGRAPPAGGRLTDAVRAP